MVLRTMNDSLQNVTTFTFVFRVGEIPQWRGTLLSDQRPVRSTDWLKENLTVAFPNLCFRVTSLQNELTCRNILKNSLSATWGHLPYLHSTRHLKTSVFYIFRANMCVICCTLCRCTCMINKYQIQDLLCQSFVHEVAFSQKGYGVNTDLKLTLWLRKWSECWS